MSDNSGISEQIQVPKRGALPTPRNILAGATPHVPRVGVPPNYIIVPHQISMWGNDVHGDCVTAEEAFAKACNQPEILISDQEVINWATQHGVLEGASVYQVLDWMRNDGFAQNGELYDDGGRSSVDWTQSDTLASAISQGPVKIGIAADQISTVWSRNQGRSGWFATGFRADANEDHCVSLCGYGTIAWLAQQLNVPVPAGVDGTRPGYAMFTWKSIGIIDVPSLLAITHEAWLRNPTTVVESEMVSPRLPSGSYIGVVSRSTDKLDIFATDASQAIRTAAWEPDFTDWWHGWWDLKGGRAAPGAPIHAVSRSKDKLDVFVTGLDGRVYTAAWEPDFTDWWHGWWPIGR